MSASTVTERDVTGGETLIPKPAHKRQEAESPKGLETLFFEAFDSSSSAYKMRASAPQIA